MTTLDLARQQGYREGYSRALADMSEQIAEAMRIAQDSGRHDHVLALRHARTLVQGLRERARRREEVRHG